MVKVYAPPEIDDCDAARDYYARNEALIEGQRAGRNGIASGCNPYPLGSQDYEDWYRGWHTATAQRVAAELRERAKKVA